MEKLELWFAPCKACVVPPHLKAEATNERRFTFSALLGCIPLPVVLPVMNLLGLNSKGGFLNPRVRGGR